MLIIILGVVLSVAFITLFERKLMGAAQRRIGPNKVGYLGIFQPITDGIKLILKESILPSQANLFLFLLAPFIVFYLSLANWLFLPLNDSVVISELNNGGILILVAITELSIFGVLYAGWSANSKYALLGSLRSTAQMISYSITLSLCILAVVFLAGDLSLMTMMITGYKWKLLLPIIPIFIVSAIAETNRAPFDLPEAESELVAGFFTEHSAIGFVYFFLGEYTSILTISTLFSLLFFSSATLSFVLLTLILWIRAVLPRYRFDQLLHLGWTSLLPFSISYCAIFLPSFLFTFDLI